jgi:hypothetical protein
MMNRHWRKIADIDEHVPINQSDEKAIMSAFQDEEGKPRNNPLWVYLIPGTPPIAIIALSILFVSTRGWSPWTLLLAGIVGLFYFVAANSWVCKRYLGPLIRKEARKRGYDICLQCGYWLQGLPEQCSTCPECGAAVTPKGVY